MTNKDDRNTLQTGEVSDNGGCGVPHDDDEFKNILNGAYRTVSKMQETVKLIEEVPVLTADGLLFTLITERSIQLLPGTTDIIQWGNYQIVLLDNYLQTHVQPSRKAQKLIDRWPVDANSARKDLAKIENFSPTFPGSHEIPRYKLGVLDAIVRRCFTKCACHQTLPGIPIEIDVAMKSPEDPHPDQHDIEFYWVTEKTTPHKEPVKLYLRMICPYTPPRKAATGPLPPAEMAGEV